MSVSKNIKIANTANQAKQTAYDKVQYPSMPFTLTIPSYTGAIAKIFGLNPTMPNKARVLEMGCASGGNIIPLATMYKDAEFVGIDLSSQQISEGQFIIEGMGLKNIKLHAMSITDLDESLGKFDYIIVHGIYSWVPEPVRNKILENAKKLLSENGVAYISYNVAPGWNMIKSIRDIMLYHTDGFGSPQEKITQAKLILKFIHEAIKNENTPYAQLLEKELEGIMQRDERHIFHDHMEEENYHPYFHEFMEQAGKNGLQYLGDANIGTMFLGNFKKEVADILGQVPNIVRQEQYMDFITNRRFRSTLLCHEHINLSRSLTANALDDLFVGLYILPEKNLADVDLSKGEELKFFLDDSKNNSLSTLSPNIQACFYAISQKNRASFNLKEIFADAKSIYNKFKVDETDLELRNLILRLVLSGKAYLYLDRPYEILEKVSDKPKLYSLALFQARSLQQGFVTTQSHIKTDVGTFDKILMSMLDGTNTIETLKSKMLEKFKDGTLNAQVGDKALSVDVIEPELQNWIKNYLEAFKNNNLLVS